MQEFCLLWMKTRSCCLKGKEALRNDKKMSVKQRKNETICQAETIGSPAWPHSKGHGNIILMNFFRFQTEAHRFFHPVSSAPTWQVKEANTNKSRFAIPLLLTKIAMQYKEVTVPHSVTKCWQSCATCYVNPLPVSLWQDQAMQRNCPHLLNTFLTSQNKQLRNPAQPCTANVQTHCGNGVNGKENTFSSSVNWD